MSKLGDALNKPIGKKEKLPTKTTMNLYVRKKSANSPLTIALTALFLVVFVLAFTRFAVHDKLEEVRVARKEYADIMQTKSKVEAAVENYDDVLEDYYRYTESYLSDGEAVLVDRIEILNMLKAAAQGCAEITAITVRDNVVTISVKTDTLEDVGFYKEKLEQDGLVTSVNVYNAQKTLIRNKLYVPPEEIDADDAAADGLPQEPEYIEIVTATMMLQMKYPEGED